MIYLIVRGNSEPVFDKRKPSEWDTECLCEDRRFHHQLWIRYGMNEIKQCSYVHDERLICSLECYSGFYYILFIINTKITSWARKQFATLFYTLFLLAMFLFEEVISDITTAL